MTPLKTFTPAQFPGAIALFEAEGWQTYTTDPERTHRALTAPGSMTLAAMDGETVIAFIQVQSDGEIQAHLSALVVHERSGRGVCGSERGAAGPGGTWK